MEFEAEEMRVDDNLEIGKEMEDEEDVEVGGDKPTFVLTPLDYFVQLRKTRSMYLSEENGKVSSKLPDRRFYSSITHMMDSALDKITLELFLQLRGRPAEAYGDSDLTLCPKCSDRLEPMLLDTFVENNVSYQRVWWTCRGLNTKTCCFPLDMPENIFWTKRTFEQVKQGIIPLPNIHLLPKKYHYLYPSVFKTKAMAEATREETVYNVKESRGKKRRYKIYSDEEKEVIVLNTPPNSRAESVDINLDKNVPMEIEVGPSTSHSHVIETQKQPLVCSKESICLDSNHESEYDADHEEDMDNEVFEDESQLDAALGKFRDVIRKSKKKNLNYRMSSEPTVVYKVDSQHREKWAEQVEKTKNSGQEKRKLGLTEIQRLKEIPFVPDIIHHISPLTNMDEVKEPEVNHVQFNEESNRQKVSLFPTGQAALNSILSLQYSGDRFLSKVNVEMCRKQMVKPTTPLPQKQRIRMSTLLGDQPDPLLKALMSPSETLHMLAPESKDQITTMANVVTEKEIAAQNASNSLASTSLTSSTSTAPNSDVRDAVDGLLALTSTNLNASKPNPTPLSYTQHDDYIGSVLQRPNVAEVRTPTINTTAFMHVEAFAKSLDLEKRLGSSSVKKDYQRRTQHLPVTSIARIDATNYSSLNSAGSSKGSTISSTVSSFGGASEAPKEAITKQPSTQQAELGEDPELKSLLQRKLKKIIKENKELFTKERKRKEMKLAESKKLQEKPNKEAEDHLTVPTMKFVDEYGFSIEQEFMPLQLPLMLGESRGETPDRMNLANDLTSNSGFDILSHRIVGEELSLDDALLL